MSAWTFGFMLGMFVGSCLGVLSMIVCDIYFLDKVIQTWIKPRLLEADREDLIALAKGLKGDEEVEAIRKAILEIAEAKPITAKNLDDTL